MTWYVFICMRPSDRLIQFDENEQVKKKPNINNKTKKQS